MAEAARRIRLNKTMADWNPWHGCKKLSPGCRNCYVYRSDGRHGRDASQVRKNRDFDLPVRRDRYGNYKIRSGETVNTCFTSDFFLDEADIWRAHAWEMIGQRSDLDFFMITKRIERFEVCLPESWGEGWDNVTVYTTVENSQMAERRLPVLMDAPIKHRGIVCEPILEQIDLRPYLGGWVEQVVVGGESGPNARPCDYSWVLDIGRQCLEHGISFWFKQTGANFIKDGRLYKIPRKYQHMQARKAGISTGRKR